MNYSTSFALNGLVDIIVVLASIVLSWWALQQLKLDLFIKHPSSGQAKILRILMATALGYIIGRFLLDYLGWSGSLHGLF